MNNVAYLSGFGSFVPPTIVTNEDLSKIVDTNSEWIETRTGIKERRIAGNSLSNTDLALNASLIALEKSGRRADELTHIIYSTCTPESMSPLCSCTLESKLKISGKAVFDINAACSGFINGLELARAIVALNPSACVLLVASEVMSGRCNWEDRSTCVLFGDGAGAVIVTGSKTPPSSNPSALVGKLIDAELSSNGDFGELLTFGLLKDESYKVTTTVGDDYFIKMQGRDVFKNAVRSMCSTCSSILNKNNLGIKDLDLFISHQANMRIIESVSKYLELPESKLFNNIEKYGNTSAASIPIALSEAISSNVLKSNMRLLIAAFGGGFVWGSAIIEF